MRYVTTGARVLLGLVYFVMGGLNGFFHFLPPPELNADADAMMGALGDTGYFIPLLKLTELVGGAMVLAGLLLPLGLVLLAPVTVHIVFFHTVLDPAGMPMALAILVLHLYLAWAYRSSFRGVLEIGAKPV